MSQNKTNMEWLTDELEIAKRNGLKILKLSYNGLQEIPSLLTRKDYFPHVEKLFLQRNRLDYLSKDIVNLQGLVELYLHGNNLKDLPDGNPGPPTAIMEIGDLQNLQILDVTSNQISALPASIGKLLKLQKLHIGNNVIEKLPKEIGCLKSLKSLEAARNKLTCISVTLCGCELLHSVSLDSNNLTFLPRQIVKLQNLRYLSVCSNNLLCLPLDIGNMKALKILYMDNNPHLTSLPASTFRKELGYHGCGVKNPPEYVLDRLQHIKLVGKAGRESQVILCPREIRLLGNIKHLCVPTLLEIALKGMFYAAEIEGVSPSLYDLPEDLHKLVELPTASCEYCKREIFTMGYPIVFEAQIKNNRVLLFGLCCTNQCVKKCSSVMNFPILHPPVEEPVLAVIQIPL